MKTTNKEKYSIAMSVKPPHRGGGLEGVSINDAYSSLPSGANAKGALVATTEALASQRSLLQQLGRRGLLHLSTL